MACDTVSLELDLDAGHLSDVAFGAGFEAIRPLHRAPWHAEEPMPPGVPPVDRHLSGDFLCAPFCSSDIEDAPWHGWTANSPWHHCGSYSSGPATTHRFEVGQPVMGARVEKQITLIDGHPLVYQRHIFHGGHIGLPVAHHLMIRTDTGVRLSFSPKRFGATPSAPAITNPAEGTSTLAYPQRFTDLARVRTRDGGTIDATRHPFAPANEDHIYLFEADGATLGWSAALNPAEAWLVFAVKDAAVLPATLLWASNFGRLNPPFAGRHGNCLGLEEICSNFALGHAASIAANSLNAMGIKTFLPLAPDRATVVDYAFGCVPVGRDWQGLAALVPGHNTIDLVDMGGERRSLPFWHR